MEGMHYIISIGDTKRVSYCDCMYDRDNSYFAGEDFYEVKETQSLFPGLKLR
jgi:hypothetical protein